MSAPRGFSIFDGYASGDPCHLVLVGQQMQLVAGTPRPKEEGGGTPTQSEPLFQPAVILLSDDGGNTLRVVARFPEARGQSPNVSFRLTSVAFGDALTGWAAGSGAAWPDPPRPLLLKSTDGGETWTEVDLPPDMPSLNAVAASGQEVWAAGRDDNCAAFLLTSADGGDTWQKPISIPRASQRCAYLSDLAVAGTTVMVTGGDGARGVVMVSHDGGQTFERSSSASDLLTFAESVAVIDSQHAYVTGWRLPSPDAPTESRTFVLLRSADGGTHWDEVAVPNTVQFIGDVLFLSQQRGYAIVQVGTPFGGPIVEEASGILVTQDAGLTWEFEPFEPHVRFSTGELLAAGDGTIYAVAGSGLYRAKP